MAPSLDAEEELQAVCREGQCTDDSCGHGWRMGGVDRDRWQSDRGFLAFWVTHAGRFTEAGFATCGASVAFFFSQRS